MSTTAKLLIAMQVLTLVAACSNPGTDSDWISYGGDPGGMRYSHHDQINRAISIHVA